MISVLREGRQDPKPGRCAGCGQPTIVSRTSPRLCARCERAARLAYHSGETGPVSGWWVVLMAAALVLGLALSTWWS